MYMQIVKYYCNDCKKHSCSSKITIENIHVEKLLRIYIIE